MKQKLFALALLAGGVVFGQVSFGISIGPPPPPRVLAVRPAAPGPDYYWVDGYWYPVGHRYHWHAGYWTRAPYAGARWFAPHYEGHEYYNGYWNGEHGRVEHEHGWDRERGRRDFDRHEEHGKEHGGRDRH